MIQIRVLLLAFGHPKEERVVDVPMEPEAFAILKQNAKLDQVFHYGQNDIQPKRHPSVSCGDVIVLGSAHYLVCSEGFKEFKGNELDEYRKLPQHERSFHGMKMTADQ